MDQVLVLTTEMDQVLIMESSKFKWIVPNIETYPI